MKKIKKQFNINNTKVEADVRIFLEEANKAIDLKWDALGFASNEEDIAYIECCGYSYELTMYGEINITNGDRNLTNSDYEEIIALTKSKEIYSEDNYEIVDSNHFYIIVRCDEKDTIESISFTECPKSIDELISILVSYVKDDLHNYKIDLSKYAVSKYYEIGEILDDGTYERGETDQGFVYKSQQAFVEKKGVCYIPELSDTEYTYDDFLSEANGNEEIANVLFDMVDWQSPGALYHDFVNSGEVHECEACQKSFMSYDVTHCPYCGVAKEGEYEYEKLSNENSSANLDSSQNVDLQKNNTVFKIESLSYEIGVLMVKSLNSNEDCLYDCVEGFIHSIGANNIKREKLMEGVKAELNNISYTEDTIEEAVENVLNEEFNFDDLVLKTCDASEISLKSLSYELACLMYLSERYNDDNLFDCVSALVIAIGKENIDVDALTDSLNVSLSCGLDADIDIKEHIAVMLSQYNIEK